MRGRILIVESDPGTRRELELALADQGYEIACAEEVSSALRARASVAHDLEGAAARRPVVAASPAMIGLLEALETLAGEDGPVLLRGEPGAGKESIARALHAQSARREAPFVALDGRCIASGEIPALLREVPAVPGSSAIGARPAPLPLAEGGTLYVEACEALAPAQQDELLRLVREGRVASGSDAKPREVDVRLVAATSRSLPVLADEADFDPTLAGCLGESTLHVPPLRQRREDIPLLVDHFLSRAAADLGRSVPTVSSEALNRLVSHHWPGNLRELESTLVHAALRAVAGTLSPLELPDTFAREYTAREASALALKPARKAFEADWIRRALRAAGGNRTHAARLLEISHRALLYKLKEFGIGDR